MTTHSAQSKLFTPLTLPNKASLEENLSDPGQLPGQRLEALYSQWANGGARLILTGSGGIVLEEATPMEPFKRWAEAGRAGNAQFWMQINHPGRQVYASMGEPAVSASDIGVIFPATPSFLQSLVH